MSYRDTYDFWMTDDYFDEDTKKELAAIADDEAEIEDRFYRDLVFGTGGLRRCDRRGNQQNELLHRPQGYTGSCKLHCEAECSRTRAWQ